MELLLNDGPQGTKNKGWFRPGADVRRNKRGRPRGKRPQSPCQDVARICGRFKLLLLPGQDFVGKLIWKVGPWVENMPGDVEIAACRVDAGRRLLVLTLKSATFERVAKGTPIPEFRATWQGLKFRRGKTAG
jgi:hypothetical protein